MGSNEDLSPYLRHQLFNKIILALRDGKMSSGFFKQLERCMETDFFDTDSIINVIGQIESLGDDLSASRIARQFTRLPLKGLWHAHHIQTKFIARNVLREVRQFNYEAFFRPHMGRVFTEDLAKKLAREIAVNKYQERVREGRATGEWIVFERSGRANFYLTLAEHEEGDQVIYDRAQAHRVLPFLSGTASQAN